VILGMSSLLIHRFLEDALWHSYTCQGRGDHLQMKFLFQKSLTSLEFIHSFLRHAPSSFVSVGKLASWITVGGEWRWKRYVFEEIEEEWYKVFWHGMQMYEDA
jgi:hypothetical protein